MGSTKLKASNNLCNLSWYCDYKTIVDRAVDKILPFTFSHVMLI